MKTISCFAGLGGAELALKRLGIKADIYAYEIDKYAEAVNRYNNPDTVFLGDITKWKEHTAMIGNVDLIIGGSPCQDLSAAGKRAGLDGAKSNLFYTYVELLKYYKPKYFVLENVNSMKNEDKAKITSIMGVEPVLLNGAYVSAQQRNRLFWTNIPTSELKDKNITVKDILEEDPDDKVWIYPKDKIMTMTATYYKASVSLREHFTNFRPMLFNEVGKPIRIGCVNNSNAQANRVYSIEGKTVNIQANGGGMGAKTGLYKIDLPDGSYEIRKLTPIEVERAFTIPDNYTKYGKFSDGTIKEISNTQRYKMLGNGFVVDVIAEGILKNMEV